MKDSGIEWIGEVPTNWKVCRFKNVANLYTGNSIKDNEKDNYLDSYDAIPYISTKDITKDFCTIDYNNGLYTKREDCNFRKAPLNSTLMCIEGGSAGIKKAKTNQEVSFVNKLCCFNGIKINNDYLYYFLNSPNYEKKFKKSINGLIGGVSIQTLKNFNITLPDNFEQQRIANFLDKKCNEINSLTSDIQKQIETLQEYKNSVITEAVTKGLDPNVEMKDSGIEWIGRIPNKWNVMKIKDTSWLKGRIGWDGLKATEFIDEGPYLITGTDFSNGYINWNTCVHITKERYEEDELLHIRENDLLITKDGTIGKVAIVTNCPKETSLNSGVMIIRNDSKYKYDSKYMYYILLSDQFKHWFEYCQKPGSTIQHLYQHQFNEFKYTFPALGEQQKIVSYLDNKCSKINEAITRSSAIIEKLEEYKKSVIYEYVTGKKEVK